MQTYFETEMLVENFPLSLNATLFKIFNRLFFGSVPTRVFLVSLKYEAASISKILFAVFSFTHVYLPFDNVNLSFKYVLIFQ